MFCKKCGKEIPDNTEFCNFCGAEQNSKIQSGTAAFTPKPKKRVGLIIGWILAVLGALSVFGSFTNGTYFLYGMTVISSTEYQQIKLAFVLTNVLAVIVDNRIEICLNK